MGVAEEERSPHAARGNVLETVGVTVDFGGVTANDRIDVAVPEGAFVGLIGPNGAGKTTFIDAITGFVESSGAVVFDDVDISDLAPHERARAGLARTFQRLELFDDLTVRENLLVAAEQTSPTTFLRDLLRPTKPSSEVSDTVEWAMALSGIGAVADLMASELPHGQRKLVAVARAIAARPKLVLLDEPAAGLDTHESLELGGRLRQLLDHDMSVLMIDHDMGLVMSVCDLVYVIDFGRVIACGTPDEIRNDDAVRAAYLGGRSGGLDPKGSDD